MRRQDVRRNLSGSLPIGQLVEVRIATVDDTRASWDGSNGAEHEAVRPRALPSELLIKIVQLGALDAAREHVRVRTRYLTNLRLVSTTFEAIATRELYRSIHVEWPAQLVELVRFYSQSSRTRDLVEELTVSWNCPSATTAREKKRGGAKEWRKAVRAFCRGGPPRLRRVSIVGPERATGAFFCLDWLEGVKDTLEVFECSRLAIASYPEVAALRFSRVRLVALSDCHPYARSQLASFYSHFPALVALEIDNDNIQQAMVEGALTTMPAPLSRRSLRRLRINQAPFLRLFTPSLVSPPPPPPPPPFPPHHRRRHNMSPTPSRPDSDHARRDVRDDVGTEESTSLTTTMGTSTLNRRREPPFRLPEGIEHVTITRVTFPETLLEPFIAFAHKHAFGSSSSSSSSSRLREEEDGEEEEEVGHTSAVCVVKTKKTIDAERLVVVGGDEN